jgi:hypothetical protein
METFQISSITVPTCSICTEPYNGVHTPVSLTACGHMFGNYCINEWARNNLKNGGACPLCRAKLVVQPTAYERPVVISQIGRAWMRDLGTGHDDLMGIVWEHIWNTFQGKVPPDSLVSSTTAKILSHAGYPSIKTSPDKKLLDMVEVELESYYFELEHIAKIMAAVTSCFRAQ